MHSSDYSRGNNANHIHEQEQQFSPIQIFKEGKNDDEALRVQIESQLTSAEALGESALTNEEDAIVVGRKGTEEEEEVKLNSFLHEICQRKFSDGLPFLCFV